MIAPLFMYGTAWKEDDTARLVTLALEAGFRAIDTANQRKHYFEREVGVALRNAFTRGLARDAVFVQSKFTFRGGQDHRLPYDPAAPVAEQVRQSFSSSREHLGLNHLDSLVLHGPSTGRGLVAADHDAWRAMEALYREGRVGALGVSNVTPEQLEAFVALAEVPIRFVQNRCYANRGWDRHNRKLCERAGITYQGFSLLTANRREPSPRGATTRA
ncbi:MAG: aldo/keto reductase, partial [Myxococcota bacterium]